jgi:hypothetical protein
MKMKKVVSWSFDVSAGYILYGCDIQDGRISDVMTTYLACRMQLMSYDLFFRATRRPPAGSYLRDTTFYCDALLCVEYGKGLQKSVIFKLQSNGLMYCSGKCTDELN